MNEKEIKEKIEFAKNIADKYGGNYKEQTFTVMLEKLIHGRVQEENNTSESRNEFKEPKKENQDDKLNKKKEDLAKLCKISVRELDDVVKIDKGEIRLQKIFTGAEAKQQVIGSQLVLLSYELVLGIPQLNSKKLKGILKESNITDRHQHFTLNLSKTKNLFSISPIAKKQKGYSLTANQGRKSAIELLHKLAKGEEIE